MAVIENKTEFKCLHLIANGQAAILIITRFIGLDLKNTQHSNTPALHTPTLHALCALPDALQFRLPSGA
jgi:hypothetical protein